MLEGCVLIVLSYHRGMRGLLLCMTRYCRIRWPFGVLLLCVSATGNATFPIYFYACKLCVDIVLCAIYRGTYLLAGEGSGYPYDDERIMAPFMDYGILMRPHVINPVVYSMRLPYYGTLGWRLPILGAPLVVVPPPVIAVLPSGGKRY